MLASAVKVFHLADSALLNTNAHGVGKILTVEELSEYLEMPLYAVSHTRDRSDFSDFRWRARPEREDA